MRSEEELNDFLVQLENFERVAKELGTSFSSATPDQQVEFVTKMHDAAFSQELDWDAPKPFMWQMKEAIVHT